MVSNTTQKGVPVMDNKETVLTIIFALLYIFIIDKYFDELDESDCNCTNHQKINYIKKTLLLQFVLFISLIVITLSIGSMSIFYSILFILIIAVMLIFVYLFNIYTIRNYVSHVLYSDCECAKKNIKIYIINIVNWGGILSLGFIIYNFFQQFREN